MLNLLCALGGHEAGETVYESGYYVSDCRRCGTAMVRSGASWRDVPGGRRRLREAARQARTGTTGERSPLPALRSRGDETAAPAARRRRWALTSPPACDVRRTNEAAAPSDARRDNPALLALAALVGAGLQLAMSLRDLRSGF